MEFIQLVPAVPSLPSNLELAPIVHHVELPTSASRKGIASARNSPIPPMHVVERRVSDQARRDSGSGTKTPRASVGSLFKSIRRSMSGESRKGSASSTHLGLPISSASPISRQQKARSPIVPSPQLRQARVKPGKISKSYDFGFSAGATKQSGSGTVSAEKSPVVPRPMTAPANKTAFSANLQYPMPSAVGVSPSTTTVSSPLPQLDIRFPGEQIDIKYSNPWGATFEPAGSFVSSIPVSPGQPEYDSRDDDSDKRTSRSAASLYKQSVLSYAQEEQIARPVRAEQESAIPIRRSIGGAGGSGPSHSFSEPSAIQRTAVPDFLPALDLPDNRISILSVDSLTSALLSPNTQRPASRKESHSRSVHQAAEREVAPHLYLDTLGGAMSLRNPFAATPRDAQETRRGSKDRRKNSGAEKSRADQTSLEEATIEFSHVRKRSTGAEETTNAPQRGKMVQNHWVSTPPAVADAQPAGIQGEAASPVPLESSAQGIDRMLSPMPTFRNPFFSKLATSATTSPLNQQSVTFASSPGAAASAARRPSTRPAGEDSPSFLQSRVSASVSRNASASETDPRRPSYASYASSSYGQFPTRPNQLESRRMTDFSCRRGIRVSLDTEAF